MMCNAIILALTSLISWIGTDKAVTDTTAMPSAIVVNDTITAWRGETVSARALLQADISEGELSLSMPGADPRFMRYVLTDAQRSCGPHRFDLKPWRVADIIDLAGAKAQPSADCLLPIWVRVDVAADAKPGLHDYNLRVINNKDEVIASAALTVNVVDSILPPPSEWAFHTDFWQQPYALSRYLGIERRSQAHLEALKPYMRELARAGQKVVTAILFYEPWGDQSHDKFDPMVEVRRRNDGTWTFSYDFFDRYVAMMDSCGINAQINCYSMIPWDMSFRYFDETSGQYKTLQTPTNTPEYNDLWGAFLTDFARHLKAEGLFDKTCIAMDERGLQAMLDAYNLLQRTVPDFKIALAGNPHPELMNKLYDYSLAYSRDFSDQELAARKRAGQISTLYTCCSDSAPNLLTNNDPGDAAKLPQIAAERGLDGYLHWSWMNWPDAPLEDSRFRLFSAGDTYLFYPGPRSSARFEKYIEGVQQVEKARITACPAPSATHSDSAR